MSAAQTDVKLWFTPDKQIHNRRKHHRLMNYKPNTHLRSLAMHDHTQTYIGCNTSNLNLDHGDQAHNGPLDRPDTKATSAANISSARACATEHSGLAAYTSKRRLAASRSRNCNSLIVCIALTEGWSCTEAHVSLGCW
ncbi:hypothetical protein M8818_002855 [Zalaria obscura]|uniref:Uncharacterized protein n=1 Tax=Zalaria obscura TaxID=2024903 RepID=A0ACC3SHH4_9PEZI